MSQSSEVYSLKHLLEQEGIACLIRNEELSIAGGALPQLKAVLNMRVDYEVLEYFRNQGKGYQTIINAVLRSYVDHRQHQEKR